MITFFNPTFWLFYLIFIVSIFLAFFIPGDLFLKKINFSFSFFQRAVLGTVIGMVLWGWQGFIFGYLGLRDLSYLYLLLTWVIWLKFNYKKICVFFKKNNTLNWDWFLILLIVLGVFIQVSSVFFVGISEKRGLFLCCGNSADNILHIALTNQIVKQFPPQEPGMAGVQVQNYHYWGNLVVGELIRVFKLPLIQTQYQYSTLFISLFLGLSAIVFSQIVKMGRSFTHWLIFFLYFGGDLIFFIVSFVRREINFQMSSLEDGAKFLVNPPRAFSIVIFFAGISLLILWLRKKDLWTGLLVALVFGSLVSFKVYTGIFVLSGLLGLSAYYLLRKEFFVFPPVIITFLLSLTIYLPVNSSAGGLYFTGLAIFENFIVQPWMMLDRLELARLIYYSHRNWPRVIQYELIYFFLYTVTIFGTKFISLFQTKKTLSFFPFGFNIFIFTGIVVSLIAGFFFQQSSGGANTFNFLVSVFIISSIYTSLACYYWVEKIKNKSIKNIFIFIIILLTIGRVSNEFLMNLNNIKNTNGLIIKNAELSAADYLRHKTEKDSLILIDYRKFKDDAESPYFSFLSNRDMFLSGMGDELSAHGIDFSFRKLAVDSILTSTDSFEVGNALNINNIDYILLSANGGLEATETASFTKVVFTNEIKILKVMKEELKKYLKEEKN